MVSPYAAGHSLLAGGFYVGLLVPLAHPVWWRLLCASLGTESAFCSAETCVYISQLPAPTLLAGLCRGQWRVQWQRQEEERVGGKRECAEGAPGREAGRGGCRLVGFHWGN